MKHSNNHRRRQILFGVSGSAVAAIWHRPIVNSVLLPAHAQTSFIADSITVSSLDSDNPFSRYIIIVDASDNVLANCGASGGVASLTGLTEGVYRVFGDSNGPQNHIITVTTELDSQQITVPTNTGNCNFLVATINFPSGSITPASGETISGPWDCFTNENLSCS